MPIQKIHRTISDIKVLAKESGRPLAVILAGHNGSGKSTMWYDHLADDLQVPLINADRMLMSVLPTPAQDGHLRTWARRLRDLDDKWIGVAQKGAQGFVAQAMVKKVPFAVETVFSHWKRLRDGSHESKIDLIKDFQDSGYFVLLLFVGLTNSDLSICRVATRADRGGHGVGVQKLLRRFPRTQHAIRHAVPVADAVILVDNSRSSSHAFTPCFMRMGRDVIYDIRTDTSLPAEIVGWLDRVVPTNSARI